jgi:hypothetical protein
MLAVETYHREQEAMVDPLPNALPEIQFRSSVAWDGESLNCKTRQEWSA